MSILRFSLAGAAVVDPEEQLSYNGAVKVFLTGGTGFIGTHLTDLLLAKGWEVYALARSPDKEPALREKQVRPLRGDLFSIPALPAGLDVVFHLAGKNRSLSSAHYYTVNQEGTASLFRALGRLGGRPKVIVLSSQAAAGPSWDGRPVRECDPPRPVTPYGWSKLRSEQEALRFKDEFPLTIVRACSVFGPRDRDFLTYFKLVARGFVISLKEEKEASLIYVKDLAEALFLCAGAALRSGEILNIADGRPYTWDELGLAAAAALGRKCRRVRLPKSIFYLLSVLYESGYHLTRKPGPFNRDKYRELIQPGWLVDVSKAAERLSFRPRYSLDKALRETISWYVAEHWL
jgi:nucleoside-diphosphate-sugar epimerase